MQDRAAYNRERRYPTSAEITWIGLRDPHVPENRRSELEDIPYVLSEGRWLDPFSPRHVRYFAECDPLDLVSELLPFRLIGRANPVGNELPRLLRAMSGELSAAEARRMVEEKRLAAVRAQLAYGEAILDGEAGSAPGAYFDVYRRALIPIASASATITGAGRDRDTSALTVPVVDVGHSRNPARNLLSDIEIIRLRKRHMLALWRFFDL